MERDIVGNEWRREKRKRSRVRRKSSIDNGEKSGIRFNDKSSFDISSNSRVEENERVDEDKMKFKSSFSRRE